MNELTYYPLSSIQNGLAFLFRFYPDLHILNLALRMDFESEINEETMAQAVREVGKRVTYLRVRLHMQDEETMVQYLSDEEPAPCEVVDLSDRTEEEIGRQYAEKIIGMTEQMMKLALPAFLSGLAVQGGTAALARAPTAEGEAEPSAPDAKPDTIPDDEIPWDYLGG